MLLYHLPTNHTRTHTHTRAHSGAVPAAEPGRGHSGGAEDAQQGPDPSPDHPAGPLQPGATHPRHLIPQEAQHLCGKQK